MPERYRVIYSPRAASDLTAIFEYIEQRSPQNAVRMLRTLVEAIDSLELFPNRNPVVEDAAKIRAGTRVMSVRPYRVYYRVLESQKAVRLITVCHGARRQPRNLG